MGGAGTTDLKAAAQGLRLPSPGALGALPGPSAGFPAPKEDWRSKFRSSDSFTSDRGTAVSQHRSIPQRCWLWLNSICCSHKCDVLSGTSCMHVIMPGVGFAPEVGSAGLQLVTKLYLKSIVHDNLHVGHTAQLHSQMLLVHAPGFHAISQQPCCCATHDFQNLTLCLCSFRSRNSQIPVLGVQ